MPGIRSAANPPVDIEHRTRFLLRVFHHRWTAPVLAEMNRWSETVGGGRVVMLVKSLDANRDSIAKTIRTLADERGWINWNPGYGHPLRPELILTTDGRPVANWCGLFVAMVEKLKVDGLIYRKWSTPVVYAIGAHGGRARFNEIKAILPDVTPRALALALKDLDAARLVRRVVEDEYPPTTWYELSRTGARLADVVERIPSDSGD